MKRYKYTLYSSKKNSGPSSYNKKFIKKKEDIEKNKTGNYFNRKKTNLDFEKGEKNKEKKIKENSNELIYNKYKKENKQLNQIRNDKLIEEISTKSRVRNLSNYSNNLNSKLVNRFGYNNNNLNIITNKNMGGVSEIEELRKENETLKLQINEKEKVIEKLKNKNKAYKNYNINTKYDIALKIDTLKDLMNGWEIKYNSNYNIKYSNLRNEKITLVGFIGLKNTGKSFIISKLLKEEINDKKYDNYLYLRYLTDFNLAIIDSPGFGRLLTKKDKIINNEENICIDDYKKNISLTDDFVLNFLLKKCNFLIVVVSTLNIYEQNLLIKLKVKDLEHKEAFNILKRIIIIHNLKDFSKKEEIIDHINNVILQSATFTLEEKEGKLTEKIKDKTKNSKYFIEYSDNKELEIYHLILAKDNSEAGDFYNQFTYEMIMCQFNHFHGNNSFDLINEVKNEIINISPNIFIKPLKSLNDFENDKKIIKVKKEFEYISNILENTNFSYIHLKPKYSYYKVNNDKELLVIIEMPGKIINRKLSCSSSKNGYYTMKFSGKKVIDLPSNFETAKKSGLFFNNREEGEFKEIFKIKEENFHINNYNYIKEEDDKNGIYRYYFQLMDENSFSDDD